MNCENCGGGLRPVGNRNYFRCPYCETFRFPDETGDGVAVVGGDAPHACPVCTQPLANAAVDGHAVGYCRVCCGFLASNAAFGTVVRGKRARPAGEPPVPVPFDPAELRRRVHCPGCRGPMDTHPYHAGGNAVIDTCPRCRLVWLDAGELTVIGSYRGRSAAVAPLPPASGRPAPTPPGPAPAGEFDLSGFRVRLF